MTVAADVHPYSSPVGIGWLAATAVVMFALAYGKATTGRALDHGCSEPRRGSRWSTARWRRQPGRAHAQCGGGMVVGGRRRRRGDRRVRDLARETHLLTMRCSHPLDIEPGFNLYPGGVADILITSWRGQSGIPSSALRYYERRRDPHAGRAIGRRLPGVRPRSVERLAFIGRAKRLGLRLDEINDLVSLWDDGPCAPVQARASGAGRRQGRRAWIRRSRSSRSSPPSSNTCSVRWCRRSPRTGAARVAVVTPRSSTSTTVRYRSAGSRCSRRSGQR